MLRSLKYDDFVLLVVVVEQHNEECVRCCVVVKLNIRVCVFYDAIRADFLVLFNQSSESQNNAIILGLPLIITRLSLCKDSYYFNSTTIFPFKDGFNKAACASPTLCKPKN